MPVDEQQIRSRICDSLGEVDTVLDVGCGNCGLVQFLAEEVARKAIGIDINGQTDHHSVTDDSGTTAGTARCLQMDAQNMQTWPDEKFDAVVSKHALHEIADPNAALGEIRRVLKYGGKLLIADFTEGETRWDEDYFTPAQMQQMLQSAGFQDVNVQKVDGEPCMFATAQKQQ